MKAFLFPLLLAVVFGQSATAQTPAAKQVTYTHYAYMKVAPGKRGEYIQLEKAWNKIWKPIHEMRVKEGKMKGWVLFSLAMPYGSALPYDMATVDVYTDMKQCLAPWFDGYLKKVHPGKDVDALLKETNDATDLVRSEVRMVVDRLEW